MIEEIIAFIIVIAAVVITIIFFGRKYIRIKKNKDDCGTCGTSSCDVCALTKIKEAKKK